MSRQLPASMAGGITSQAAQGDHQRIRLAGKALSLPEAHHGDSTESISEAVHFGKVAQIR